jgi:hypothetical protein
MVFLSNSLSILLKIIPSLIGKFLPCNAIKSSINNQALFKDMALVSGFSVARFSFVGSGVSALSSKILFLM